jgi:hypothetical protein
MAKLDSLTGRGATRVMLSVFEGMRRGVRGAGAARRGRGEEGKGKKVTRSCESRGRPRRDVAT